MKHDFEDVIDGHQASEREIAKMISHVPIEIVKTQRYICGLGAALHFVGLPQFTSPKAAATSIVSFVVAFVVIYFFAKFLELGIIFGGSFFRSTSTGWLKFAAVLNGIIVLLLSAVPSILLGGMLFDSISIVMGKTDLASLAIGYALGAIMPTMQVLMQIYKPHREELIKESTNAQDLQKHAVEKKQEALIALETMKAIERVAKDPKYQQQIEDIIVKVYEDKIRASNPIVVESTVSHEQPKIDQQSIATTIIEQLKTELPLLLPSPSQETLTVEAVTAIVQEQIDQMAQAHMPTSEIVDEVKQTLSDVSVREEQVDRVSSTSNHEGSKTILDTFQRGQEQPSQDKMIDTISLDTEETVSSDSSDVETSKVDNIVPFPPRTNTVEMSGQRAQDEKTVVRKQSKYDQIVEYLRTLSKDDRITWWNDLSGLGQKFETSAKTAQRAFTPYPESKQKRRTADEEQA